MTAISGLQRPHPLSPVQPNQAPRQSPQGADGGKSTVQPSTEPSRLLRDMAQGGQLPPNNPLQNLGQTRPGLGESANPLSSLSTQAQVKFTEGSPHAPQTPKTQPMTIERATEVLDRDFAIYDTAKQGGGQGDNKISQNDLRTVAENKGGKYTAEQQATAQLMLDSKAGRNFLDTANGKGSVDGTISREDVTAARNAIADGSYTHRMLDTASTNGGWFSGPDGKVSQTDIDAALNDPGMPQSVKDAIQLARAGQPDASLDFLGSLTADKAKAASSLLNSAEYKALSDDEKKLVAQAWREGKGDTAVVQDVRARLSEPAFQSASPAMRADRLREVTLLQSKNFKSLPASDQQLVRDALTNRRAGDERLAQTLDQLMRKDKFQSLSPEEKTAVLSQMKNYPDARVADNFGKLLGKPWFSGGWFGAGAMSLSDKQRTLKAIAVLTVYEKGDRKILDNTLKKLLDEDYSLDWSVTNSGSAHSNPGTRRVSMSQVDVHDGNDALLSPDANPNSEWQVVNAIPHEINHAIDDVHVSGTHEYLDKEYQAYYAGNKAQTGRPMTRAEAIQQWNVILGISSSTYRGPANQALSNETEAKKIFDQLSRLTGVEVNKENYKEIMTDPIRWNPPFNDPDYSKDIKIPNEAKPKGNTDNS